MDINLWNLILLCNWYLNTFFFFEWFSFRTTSGLVYLWVLWNKWVFDCDYWVLKVTTQRQFLTPVWTTPLISSCKKAMECYSPKSTSARRIVWSPSTLTIATSECPGTTSCISTWVFPSAQLPSYSISLLKLGIGSSTIDTAFAIFYTTWMIIQQTVLLTAGNARTTLAPSGPRPPAWDHASPGENWRLQYSSFFLGHRAGFSPFHRLPEKLSTLRSLLQSWSHKRVCRRQELESLLGCLHHAAKVVYPGRPILLGLTDLLCGTRSQSHLIRLNRDTRANLLWWSSSEIGTVPASSLLLTGLICQTSRCPLTLWELPLLVPTSTAFGLLVAGFPSNLLARIAFKELHSIVIAAQVWGHQWQGLGVQFLCDNRSVTVAISEWFCSDGALRGLLRSFFLAATRHSCWVSATHVPGDLNSIASALFCSQVQWFRLFPPPAGATATKSELAVLQQHVTQFLNVSLALSTRWSYLSEFCVTYSLLHPSGCPFPVSESMLEMLVVHLASSASYGTIKSYLRSVHSLQIDLGLVTVATLHLDEWMDGWPLFKHDEN